MHLIERGFGPQARGKKAGARGSGEYSTDPARIGPLTEKQIADRWRQEKRNEPRAFSEDTNAEIREMQVADELERHGRRADEIQASWDPRQPATNETNFSDSPSRISSRRAGHEAAKKVTGLYDDVSTIRSESYKKQPPDKGAHHPRSINTREIRAATKLKNKLRDEEAFPKDQ